MSTLADVRPGDIMFSKRLKPRAVEALVWGGQMILAETGYPQHVGVVVDGGRLVQAMPKGAEVVTLDKRHWTGDITFIRPNYRSEYTAPAVARAALRYVGTPYSFLDYAAIAGLHLGIKNGPIRRYVRTSQHMICSQLADQALADAGWHVFDDGRLAQDVTPVALYVKMLADNPAAILGLGRA